MLLSFVLKILTKILTKRETNKSNISEEQQGFRRNRSTIDAIFILKQLIEKTIEFNKPLFLCFVDLKQAFDKMRLSDVLKNLKERDIDGRCIKVIAELNRNSNTRIKVKNTLTEVVSVIAGIRQGDSLSSILFNLIIDK